MKILTFIGGAVIAILATLCRGFALKTLWAWFIVPQFGLAPLRIIPALGIALTLQYILCQSSSKDKQDPWSELLFKALLMPFFTLALGWLIHLFA